VSRRTRRRWDSGLVRGCCLGVIVLVIACGISAYAVDRAVAAPDLGAPPGGPDHGSSELAIAAALGPPLAATLGMQPHGAITLSEHDLSVIASAHNPDPAAYRNVAVRVRDTLLVLAADVSVGPIASTAVARISVSVADPDGAPPRITSQLEELDAGQLGLPGWLRDRFAGVVTRSTSLTSLFADNPLLSAAAAYVECASVGTIGLRIGIHRPGVAPDPSVCAS
jgi:hypothetical protein